MSTTNLNTYKHCRHYNSDLRFVSVLGAGGSSRVVKDTAVIELNNLLLYEEVL